MAGITAKGRLPSDGIRTAERYVTRTANLAKRCIDVAVSAVSLLVFSPLLVAISVAVRVTSPGHIFFRQARMGRSGVPFKILKFRTMYVNAPDVRNADGSAFSGANDPRVTRVGAFLRRSSLDELPQLFNVFRGAMSLVGPRPDQVDQIQYYTADERRKLEVKPGITGLAQISGRNSIPWAERKRLDLEYVRRQSLALDLRIMVKTLPCWLLRRGIETETASDPAWAVRTESSNSSRTEATGPLPVTDSNKKTDESPSVHF